MRKSIQMTARALKVAGELMGLSGRTCSVCGHDDSIVRPHQYSGGECWVTTCSCRTYRPYDGGINDE